MISWKRALLVALAIFVTKSAEAAPHPGVTSALAAPKLGVFRSPIGFEIASGDSGWLPTSAPNESKNIATVYRPSAWKARGINAMLTVRVDKLKKPLTLDAYVKRWSKEYPKFGFDVLGSKPFVQNNERGYVLDLINRDNNRQLRQVIFLKEKNAVILTCRDQASTFKSTLKSCNEIIRTFRWSI